uniref:Uncharacterized protein n=1 Tax=Sinocyclocheilus grahami TaxID=75366 RepID=A0A672M251_SINGR
MASSSSVSKKSLTCSICLDVFTDPVTTSCGHNFCMVCIRSHRDHSPCPRCPLCGRELDSKQDFSINRTIKEIAEDIKRKRVQEKPEVSCDSCPNKKMRTAIKSCLHCGTSFCESHLEPHKTAEKLMKHKLINPVKNLEEYICKNHERPLDLYCRDDQTAICQFCTESDHRTHNTVPLEKESLVIISRILNSTMKMNKIQQTKTFVNQLQGPQDYLVLFCKHLLHEPLYNFSVDVTLDPDTAHPELMLSDDGKKVWNTGKSQKIPDTPERFNYCSCVLGKEGFSSQKFYYEVQVSAVEWDLGVAKESIDRKGDIGLNPENGYWTIWLRNRTEYAANDCPPVPLTLKEKPVKVGVFVDFEEGLVSFYDVEARYHIYSFTGQSFPGKLYPYFSKFKNAKCIRLIHI